MSRAAKHRTRKAPQVGLLTRRIHGPLPALGEGKSCYHSHSAPLFYLILGDAMPTAVQFFQAAIRRNAFVISRRPVGITLGVSER